jgi:hypothetical protein
LSAVSIPFKNISLLTPKEITSAHNAFEETICRYQECVAASGGIQCINYGKGAESGKSTHSGSSQTVKPSDSDFICDIEIQARRCLNSGELSYFNLYYKSCEVVVEPKDVDCLQQHIESFPEKYWAAVGSIDNRMRLKLGSRLLAVGVHPLNEYLASVDVRSQRKPKIRWSHLY